MSTLRLVHSILAVFLLISLLTPIMRIATPVNAEQIVISVSDPEGDDRGPGYYGYPKAEVFKPGVFDLVRFEVLLNDTHVIFRVYYKNLGGNPWNGPNGFCLQYTQIYIRTTEKGLLGRMDTIGANVVLRPDYAWYYALLLAPGWDTEAVPVGQKAALYYSNGTIVVQDSGFNVYADMKANAIIAVVPRSLLSDLDHIANWSIVVLALSYDGFGPMRVRPVSVTGGDWVINGSAYATTDQVKRLAKAITAGVEPRVMDLLIYSPEYRNGVTADQQYKWLDSFDPDKMTPATIPYTPTVLTVTTTYTTTQTVTTTQTSLMTTTYTTTLISTTTTTTTVTTVDWTTTSVVGVVLLVIGFLIGFFARRK